jgi:hypothetical protein
MDRSRAERWFLGAGVTAPVVKATGIIVAGTVEPGYSHTSQAISELSAEGSPSAGLHRSTTVASGLLQGVFACGLARRAPAAAVTFATVAVAALGGAAFRCSPGCPPLGSSAATRSDTLHNTFGFAGGAALILAPGLGVRQRRLGNAYRTSSVILAAGALATGGVALGGLSGRRRGTLAAELPSVLTHLAGRDRARSPWRAASPSRDAGRRGVRASALTRRGCCGDGRSVRDRPWGRSPVSRVAPAAESGSRPPPRSRSRSAAALSEV